MATIDETTMISAVVDGERVFTDGKTVFGETEGGALITLGPLDEASSAVRSAFESGPAPWEVWDDRGMGHLLD